MGPRIRKIVADDISRMEAQNTIKRKREKKAVRVKKEKLEEAAKLVVREVWKANVKKITHNLIAQKKTREEKASTIPQIRDFLGKNNGISKSQTSSWNVYNIVKILTKLV